jgi:hypothetical protein
MHRKGGLKVSHTEFTELHASGVTAMRAYFVEVERTATMLAKCTAEPLSFKERFRLMSQGIVENDTHLIYLSIKSLLLSAARLGYGFSN